MFIPLRTSAFVSLLVGLVAAAQPVPRLIRFEGSVPAVSEGAVAAGRFSIYRQEFDGVPLWSESQNIRSDQAGRYTVLLGATGADGVPAGLFQTAEPRWLEVEVNSVKQPRVLLASVPYAARSGDADTLGGLPASAFLRLPLLESAAAAAADHSKRTPPGHDNAVPQPLANNCLVLWFNSTTNCSMVTQDTVSGGQELIISGSQGFSNGLFYVQNTNAGGNNIATLASPNLPAGNETFFNLGVSNTPLNWVSQGFHYEGSGSGLNRYDFQFAFAPLPAFSILAGGNVGFGTVAPTQKLEVVGTGKFSGGIMFGDGSVQTTAATGGVGVGGGSGTITGVTAGNGLTGGGTSGAVTVNVDATKVPLLNANNVFTGNQTLSGTTTMSGSQGFTNGLFSVQNTNASGGNNIASLISPNLPAGNETFFNLGVSNTPNNWVSQGFYYAGNGSAANRYDFQFAFAPQPAFSILAGGNVGFGTTTPGQKLEVNGTVKATGGIMFGDGTKMTTAPVGAGAGTISGVTAGNGLVGGGTSGAVALSIDATRVPLVTSANTFTANQTMTGNLQVNGAVGVGTVPPTGVAMEINGGLQVDGGYILGPSGSVLAGVSPYSTGAIPAPSSTPPPPTSSANNVFMGPASGAHNTTGDNNTAIGSGANGGAHSSAGSALLGLGSRAQRGRPGNAAATTVAVTGSNNAAIGTGALYSNISGNSNIAIGGFAIGSLTSGDYNVAIGHQSMSGGGFTGTGNVAIGAYALSSAYTLTSSLSGNNNIAIGNAAGAAMASGSNNIYIGGGPVSSYPALPCGHPQCTSGTPNPSPSESRTIRIGIQSGTPQSNQPISNSPTPDPNYQLAAYIAGISGTNVSGVPVIVSSSGQLGVATSSRRFKKDIEDMGDATGRLMRLRPVTYRYKEPYADGTQPVQYGLIAEEVAEVFPELVAHSADGQIETVKYQELAPMLLNEVQKLHAQNAGLKSQNESQQQQIRALEERLARLEAALTSR